MTNVATSEESSTIRTKKKVQFKYMYIFSIRVENSVNPDQMAPLECF